MRGLQRINSPALIDNFVLLWNLMQTIVLTENIEDTVSWNLTSNHCYSASSAYLACFLGRIQKPFLAAAWEVKVEAKVKFFLWLLLQNRLWTSDRLAARGWPHNDNCVLCDQVLESANHLFPNCPFVKEVWHGFSSTHVNAAAIGGRSSTITGWWRKISRYRKKKETKSQVTAAVYVAWHIWKERSRRIFESCSCSPMGLVVQIRADLTSLALAFGE
ncbi:unnamed protein product [Alopecurus aequalis]